MIAEPPSFSGASHVSVTAPSVASATRFMGAPGTVWRGPPPPPPPPPPVDGDGVASSVTTAPLPRAFTARTRNTYFLPFVRLGTVADLSDGSTLIQSPNSPPLSAQRYS